MQEEVRLMPAIKRLVVLSAVFMISRFCAQRLESRCQIVSGQPGVCPRRLKVEPSRDAVNVQDLPGKIEPGNDSALEGPRIHFSQIDTATGDKLLFVGRLSLN